MSMHNPPHPGVVLKEMYFEPLGLNVTAAAKALDISRQGLSDLLHKKRNISVEMALRLAKSFNTTPERWLNLQIQYDLWKYRNKKWAKVKCLIDTDRTEKTIT